MVDDEKSIYVGGIPYDCTDDSLRSVFDLYGAVVAIKIINDKNVGGKCFAFITFSNPRSAQDAIMDMNGRSIGGRMVRVNEVRNRNNNNQDSYHENFSRGTSREKLVRGPYQYQNQYKYKDRNIDYDRSCESSFDLARRDRDEDLPLDRHWNEDRSLDRGSKRDRSLDRYSARDETEDWDSNKKDRDEDKDDTKKRNGRNKTHGEISSNTGDDNLDELRGLLEKRIEKRNGLCDKIDSLRATIHDKRFEICSLQKKSQNLEDELHAAEKLASQRKLLLHKLYRCFVQFQKHEEKVKLSGKELEALVNEALVEIDKDEIGGAGLAKDVSPFVNGQL